ncbi:DUF2130 domain-containing protein [Mycoplasma sp. 'Moose RK']|uniref:DUF2130 domain-containing protein n=1 Tax=Mycoplasma sp. 'Moose RK' TaxID=2780095 RepID=UPI0018C2B357|nr:DUF2130 domain-containing protein [Mycoplasma sp. 'Moose RK']MBG0730913.1 DUF2130 domain-containing protein [Mycoplasma sp. 'Moose RK']
MENNFNTKKSVSIKIVDRDRLKYELLEDAKKGDWFSIIGDVESYIDSRVKEREADNEERIRNNILEHDPKIRELKEENKKLQDDIRKNENEFNKKVSNLRQENSEKINKSDIEINNLKNEIKNLKENLNDKVFRKVQEELAKKKDEIEENWNRKIKEEIKKAEDNAEKNKNEKIELLEKQNKEKLEDKDKEIKKLEDEKEAYRIQVERVNRYNSKQIGEDLEKWILNQYRTFFPNLGDENENFSMDLRKDNDVVVGEGGGTKTDFVFEIIDKKEIKDSKRIVIEAKSESSQKTGSQKNASFFKKLENDRNKKKAEYAILVTELEDETSITVEVVQKYPKIFMCRPQYFLTLLALLKSFILKEKYLSLQLLSRTKNFDEKNEIILKFNEWKEKKIIKAANKIKKESEICLKSSKKITEHAREITENLEKIINVSIINLIKDVEEYKIEKVAKKIEKLTDVSKNIFDEHNAN